MLLNQNYEILFSVFFYFTSKFLSYIAPMFHDKRITKLTAIPERNETDNEEKQPQLWVPKKKHDMLKAKYKCLKKLFQIYDASVIGILPNGAAEGTEDDETPRRRKKRRPHHKTGTDACTSVINTNVDHAKVLKDSENNTEDFYDKNDTPRSDTSIQVETIAKSFLKIPEILKDDKCIQDSDENIPKRSNSAPETNIKPIQVYQNVCEKRKSRFQNYFQRLFGLKNDKVQIIQNQEYRQFTKSDNNISNCKRRKRKALKVTSLRRSKHVTSEFNLRDVDILSHIQLIQRHCLMDRTQRQCPFVDCKMMTYGIINYNDHLNLCHFPERKHICHYCHEGFESNKERLIHENEHIGINKLTSNLNKPDNTESDKKVSIAQTEPNISEEKLLKIMSFIEKIPNNSERSKNDIKPPINKYRDGYDSGSCGKKTTSWPNFSSARGTKGLSKSASESSPRTTVNSGYTCKMCGEEFGERRFLQFHVNVDHRDMTSKPRKPLNFTKNRQLSVNENSLSQLPSVSTLDCRKKNAVTYDPSTNIIYYTSLESIDESGNDILEDKMSSSTRLAAPFGFKWESETKIIRV